MPRERTVASKDLNTLILTNSDQFNNGRYVAANSNDSHNRCTGCAFYTTDLDYLDNPTDSNSCGAPGDAEQSCWNRNRMDDRDIIWKYAGPATSAMEAAATGELADNTLPDATGKHEYYDLITEFYGNYKHNHDKLWSWDSSTHRSRWVKTQKPTWDTTRYYKISADSPAEPPEELQMVTFPGGTVKFYKPESKPLADGDDYWFVDLTTPNVRQGTWKNNHYDWHRLESGLVYKQESRAMQQMNALVQFMEMMATNWKDDLNIANPK